MTCLCFLVEICTSISKVSLHVNEFVFILANKLYPQVWHLVYLLAQSFDLINDILLCKVCGTITKNSESKQRSQETGKVFVTKS